MSYRKRRRNKVKPKEKKIKEKKEIADYTNFEGDNIFFKRVENSL